MRKLPFITACGAALLLGACARHFDEGATVATRVDDPRAADARIHYDQVVIIDSNLQSESQGSIFQTVRSKIAVESQGARRTQTGTLRVIVQFRNRTDYKQVIQARVSFFDANYVQSEQPSAWVRIFLDPKGIATFDQGSSSVNTEEAAHYYVEVRETS